MSKKNYRDMRQILQDAGEKRIAAESERSSKRVTAEAVYKWRFTGIPSIHQALVMRLSGATADELLTANIACQAQRSQRAA